MVGRHSQKDSKQKATRSAENTYHPKPICHQTNSSYWIMAPQNIRQNEPSTTLQSARQNRWYFRGVLPSTPANRTRQHSPVIRPKHDCLEELSVHTLLTKSTEYVRKYTEKENFLTRSYYLLRQPSLSAAMSYLLELKGPGNNKATTRETNLYPPGQRKIHEEVLCTTFNTSY